MRLNGDVTLTTALIDAAAQIEGGQIDAISDVADPNTTVDRGRVGNEPGRWHIKGVSTENLDNQTTDARHSPKSADVEQRVRSGRAAPARFSSSLLTRVRWAGRALQDLALISCGPAQRRELCPRRRQPGWDAWSHEVGRDVEL